MAHAARWWDETEETGLRLCAENSNSTASAGRGRGSAAAVSTPAQVTACCWDVNTPGRVGLCGADGSFVLANHDHDRDITTAITSYAVYFNTLPVHLWGRRRGVEDMSIGNSAQQPPVASAPARRVSHPWSIMSFVPDHPGEIVFVQGWSCRLLWAKLPQVEDPRTMAPTSSGGGVGIGIGGRVAAAGRFGLVDGSRVVALEGHHAQVKCMSMDSLGQLLVTGDDSGSICARLLHPRESSNSAASRAESARGTGDTAYPSQEFGAVVVAGGAELGAGSGSGGGGVAKVVEGAHKGDVLAIRHVEGSLRMSTSMSRSEGLSEGLSEHEGGAEASWSSLFVSGGKGGIVRLWRATATCEGQRRQLRRHTARVEPSYSPGLHVELVKDMLVGGFQVSCLAASLSPRLPLVLAGTKEGTVFAFHLQEQQRQHEPLASPFSSTDANSRRQRGSNGDGDGVSGGEDGVRPRQIPRADGTAGVTELGAVLMKFEHTREAIEGVCSSREQDLIAVADAGGKVRTYRPVPGEDAPEDSSKRNPSSAAAVGVGLGLGVGLGDAPARPFELVVECRLGARPASCEFEFAMGASTGRRRRIRRRDSGGGGGLDDGQGSGQHPGGDGEGGRDGDGGGEGGGEVLRTCTVSGSIRVWPTSSLPTRPLRPPPTSTLTSLTGVLAPLSLPLPPRGQRPSNAGDSGNNNATGGGKKGSSRPPAASVGGRGQGQENTDPFHPFSRWAASASDDQGRGTPSSAGGSGGAAAVGRGEEAAEGEGEEELVGGGLGEAPVPLPKAKPGARRRRVSFAPEDEVYKLHDPYYSTTTPWGVSGWERERGYESKDDGGDGNGNDSDSYNGDFEAPRPPPPAPTPMPPSVSPSDSTRPRRLRQSWGIPPPSARGGSTGSRGGSMDGVMRSSGDEDDSRAFVPPSKLQEASLWSTAVEQAALERRMREEFDARAVPEPSEPVYRVAAAGAVNIHPSARTFEGLVPVSLDAPPPRPKRKGKQVSKRHLSKVQEQRITEEDLAFDGMEPDCSAIAGFGSDSGGRMWPHEELEWYGGRSLFAELDASSVSMASDRVWSLGRRL